jgi:NAD(P)-dependent dehydrogenase (short-subunit alcohol dehydrogenase family)
MLTCTDRRLRFCSSVSKADMSLLCRDAATYEKILKVNVVGPYLVTRTFVPLLLKKNTRTVVQMSSGLGSITRNRLGMTDPEKNPVGNKWIAYNASKAALNMREYCLHEYAFAAVFFALQHARPHLLSLPIWSLCCCSSILAPKVCFFVHAYQLIAYHTLY